MKLWHVARRDQCGYDEYDSFVCAAEDEQTARLTHPSGSDHVWTGRTWRHGDGEHPYSDDTWPAPGKLKVQELGTAAEGVAGVQCSSFNAG